MGFGDLSHLDVVSESVYVGLHDDIHEGFEETEDQPAVDHLDVSGGGEVGAHTLVFSKYKCLNLIVEILPLEIVCSELT